MGLLLAQLGSLKAPCKFGRSLRSTSHPLGYVLGPWKGFKWKKSMYSKCQTKYYSTPVISIDLLLVQLAIPKALHEIIRFMGVHNVHILPFGAYFIPS